MNYYPSKLFVNLMMLASVTAIIIFGMRAGMHAEQLALIIAPLFVAAQQLLPGVEPKKVGATIYPPEFPKGVSIPPSPTLAKLMAEMAPSIPPVAISTKDEDSK